MGWVRRPWVVEWFCEELLDPKGGVMKSERTIMEILEAFDLVGTYSGAARLAGCAPNTVKRYVLARERGENVPVGRKRRVGIVDAYRPKIEELVEQSQGQIEARVVFSGWYRWGTRGHVVWWSGLFGLVRTIMLLRIGGCIARWFLLLVSGCNMISGMGRL